MQKLAGSHVFGPVLILATALLVSCASQPLSRNQQLAFNIQTDGFNTGWDNRQQCLEDSNFSPSVLAACLAQQPPGTDEQGWAARCFQLADLGDNYYGNFSRRIIAVADCYLPRKFFEPDSLWE
jgi:hypothetical protein